MKVLATTCLMLALAPFAIAQKDVPCKLYFSIVQKDELNNLKQGVTDDTAKWLKEKVSKKYPGVCYHAPEPSIPLVFYISITRSTYHGTKTVTDSSPISGTVRDKNGNTANIQGEQQTRTVVPNNFEYPLLTLSLETRTGPDKWKVVHTFQKHGICNTLYGMRVHCHPAHDVIEQAVKWLHAGGLDDPLQSVVAQ